MCEDPARSASAAEHVEGKDVDLQVDVGQRTLQIHVLHDVLVLSRQDTRAAVDVEADDGDGARVHPRRVNHHSVHVGLTGDVAGRLCNSQQCQSNHSLCFIS